jgi:hypothetical protein
MALLWATLVWFELDSKAASGNLKRIRRALEATGMAPGREAEEAI